MTQANYYLQCCTQGCDGRRFLSCLYRGADKSLARPDRKETIESRHFSSDAPVIAAAETWLDGQPSEFFLSALQM